ncbi:hypothetical protein SAMN05428957_10890 [Oryzisolibacter propanilivorax]|uniref:Uncharacterized protein n=1 Tax=Oryzisolibacter propanilivorax TaxID=1527607 RepID=A0A1G9UBG3_9BURK|nr:hypothetical protein [Oryzisolibacter propanilivorax]SDM57291.1 hypothetical protein SAMN05428957_10890 [Oryzisolibacter propanilivorax]
MSKAHAKNPTPAAQEPAPQHTPAPAAASAADPGAAVVQPAPPAAPADEHHGRGGLYIRSHGVRTLVERTGHSATPSAPSDPQE